MKHLTNVVSVAVAYSHSLALKSDGTVVCWGYGNNGQCTPPADLTNAIAIAAGWRHSVALRNDGSVVAWGDNSSGQCNPQRIQSTMRIIAAGGDHVLAAMFSPLIEYPVEVAKDLLLIYNTNSADSIFIKDYYLAHRPMVSNANVLGIGCPGTETVFPWDYTNTIQTPIHAWLAANPTRRPQYVVLFLDVPARVNKNSTNYYDNTHISPSVSYHLRESFTGWRPFVTHINMGGTLYGTPSNTADCVAYINKLEHFGTNYSPGQLIISASKGGYGNTNYVVNNVMHDDYRGENKVSSATNGLIAAGVSLNSILYSEAIEVCTNRSSTFPFDCFGRVEQPLMNIHDATNVAGYVSWGVHSSLRGMYPLDGTQRWHGESGWWISETAESFNGWRQWPSTGHFIQWFSKNAFGGTNYENTAVGAVSHTDEPGLGGVNDSAKYFGSWALGRRFGNFAWNSAYTERFQAVGDPLVTK